MRYLIVLSALAVALAASATANAGGFATVGLEPALPAGVGPGDTWNTEMTVLQHGVTPIDGLSPTITITSDSGATREFAATPTGESGVYEASVVFPEEGAWRVVADSSFGESRLTYGPVTIGSDPAGAPSSFPVVPVAGVAAALGLLAALFLGAVGVRRARKLTPASG